MPSSTKKKKNPDYELISSSTILVNGLVKGDFRTKIYSFSLMKNDLPMQYIWIYFIRSHVHKFIFTLTCFMAEFPVGSSTKKILLSE